MNSRERHVWFDFALTDSEARNLLLVLENVDGKYFGDDEYEPLFDLADALRAKLIALETINQAIYVDFASKQVLEDRKYSDEAGEYADN